jgi:DNA-binding PucR family transcriptional regulator
VLLDALLSGRDVSVVSDVARTLELPEHGAVVAVVAEVPSPGVDALPGVDQALRTEAFHSVWRQKGHRKTGIVVVGPGQLDDRLAAMRSIVALRAMARVGIGPVFHQLLHTASCVRLAEVALGCLAPGARDVAAFDDHPVDILVAGSPDLAEHTARIVLGPVLDLTESDQQTLLGTLTAWIDAGGSFSRAGEQLFCHRNTVRNRLQRIESLTGRSLTDPQDLTEVCVAARAVDLRPTPPNES